MQKIIIIIFLIFSFQNVGAQNFVNEDLNGTIGISVIPTGWQAIPYTDPNCLANNSAQATADVTGITGPQTSWGINGNPYSGNTFLSGIRGTGLPNVVFQEGIMQVVNGFSIGCFYTINFHQSVVKQINGLDTSGAWAIYLDTTLIGTTSPSTSQLPYNSNNLTWDFRSILFLATATSHNIKFLPVDDDSNTLSSYVDIGGGLRMGIDSIYIEPITGIQNINFLGNDTVICSSSNYALDASMPNSTYLWQDSSTNPVQNVVQSGIYWVQVTNSCGTFLDTIKVLFPQRSNLNLGNDTTICSNQNLLLNATVNGNVAYLWQDNSTNPTYQVTNSGIYWVEITDSCGSYSDTIQVSNFPSLFINLGNDTTICKSSFILSSNNVGVSYLWQDNSTNPNFNVTKSGKYWVEIFDGCSYGSDTIQVTLDSVPEVQLGRDIHVCANRIINLNAANAGASYLWQDASTDSIFLVQKEGKFWVVVSNFCGSNSDSITVTHHTTPTVSLINDTSLCFGDVIILKADIDNVSYQWQNFSTNNSFYVSRPGIYTLIITDSCGSSKDEVNVSYNDCGCSVFLPNAFSPNNDLKNDFFGPIFNCNNPIYELSIFNRWGNLVFFSDNVSRPWDGTYRKQPASIDTYFYILKYQYPNQEKKSVKGDLTIIR